jgi:tRNA (guanine-N7-)-methyltransferase
LAENGVMRDSDPPAVHRSIRSYVLRQGRLTAAQARALAEVGPRFVLPFAPQTLDLDLLFGRHAPRTLEIGFGNGETTAAMALAQPERDFLAVEVHSPGVGALLRRLDALQLGNVRIVQHDVTEVLREMIPPGALDAVHVFFPDPWPKKRHHKRRLVQPPFVALLASRLAPGGVVHLATDWEDYARQMLAALSAEPLLVNTAPGFALRPETRPPTRFERRGERLGHGVWDLVFRRADRRAAPAPGCQGVAGGPEAANR